MALIEPIPGQEERNRDHLLEEGAAIRCKQFGPADGKIAGLLDDTPAVTRMKDRARKLGRSNAAARHRSRRVETVRLVCSNQSGRKESNATLQLFLIDADDTLWENNVFFENLIEDFIPLVEPCGFHSRLHSPHPQRNRTQNIASTDTASAASAVHCEETLMKLAEHLAKRETLAEIHNRVVDLERNAAKNFSTAFPKRSAYLTERHRLILFHQRANQPSNPPKFSAPACKASSRPSKSSTKKIPSLHRPRREHKIVKAHG